MNNIEELKEFIKTLSKEELIELRDLIKKKLHVLSPYIPSNDSEIIAEYAKRFQYDEKRKEEILKKIK